MAGQSVTFDFLSRGASTVAGDFRKVGDNTALAARGAKVLSDAIERLGAKEDRTAAESKTLAAALRQTGDAEDRMTAKTVLADAAIRRLDDAMKDSGKSAGGARGGIGGLIGEVTGFGAAADAANSSGSKFGLVMAGLNLASGVLEPALAGIVVAAGGLAAGFAAAGTGLAVFGAVAKTVLTQASTAATATATAQDAHAAAVAKVTGQYQIAMGAAKTQAQRNAAYAAEQKGFQQAALTQQVAVNKATAGLSPPVKTLAIEIGNTKTQWKAFTDAAAPGVVGVLSQGIGILTDHFGMLKQFLGPVETALSGILAKLNTGLNSAGFKSFLSALAANAGPAITKIATAIGNVVVGIGGILKAFMPVSQSMLSGVDKITAKFREWGTTLSGNTGFQSLMATFRTETPQAMAILRNLGTVLVNVGKAMFGLSTFSNSKVLLQALLPLSSVLASLSKNTGLVRIVLYLAAAAAAAKKLGPAFLAVKSAVAFFPAAAASIVTFSGVTEGATVAQTIAAAATRAWGLAMDALPWVALAAAVVAVALLIIKYHTQIWHFMIRVWNDILQIISGVWGWIQKNWPLLLAILTGPIGLAALQIIRHWNDIKNALDIVLHAISAAWNTVWGALRNAFRIFIVAGILTPLGWIIDGAAKAFGWIPGLGGKLQGAARAFDQFRANVNASLGGINGRTVNVQVALSTGGLPGITTTIPAGVKHAATGMYVAQGTGPTADDVLIRASKGELVVPANMVRSGAVDHLRGAIPGFAAGGPVGVNVTASAPTYAAITAKLMASINTLAKAFGAATGSGISTPVGNIGSGVGRWAGLVRQALAMEHLNPAYILDVLYQMQTESGGNPNAINNWDSNAAMGDPSRGLMQTIMSTFLRWHWPGTSFNIYDPLANIAAAINYSAHGRGFGSGPGQMGSGHGYATGTAAAAPGWAWVGEAGPEMVKFRGGEQVIPGYAGGGTVGQQGSTYLKAWQTRHGGGYGAAWGPVPVNPQIDTANRALASDVTLAGASLPAAQHKHYVAAAAWWRKHRDALVHERDTMGTWRAQLGASDRTIGAWIAAAGNNKALAPSVGRWKRQRAWQETEIAAVSKMLGWSAAHQAAAAKAAATAKAASLAQGVLATHSYGGDVTNSIGATLAAALGPFTGTFDRGGTLRPGWNRMYNATGRPEALVPARGGGGTVQLEVASGGSTEFDRFMVGWMRKHVHVKGGGSAQRAFGSR